MVTEGGAAPDFTAPIADGGVSPFTPSDQFGDGPIVLAFFPGAFTGVCTTELCTFQDTLSEFEEVVATVYGISVDTPFALDEFRDQKGLEFGLVSGSNEEIIDDPGVEPNYDEVAEAAAAAGKAEAPDAQYSDRSTERFFR